jgi:hypothetical protein
MGQLAIKVEDIKQIKKHKLQSIIRNLSINNKKLNKIWAYFKM